MGLLQETYGLIYCGVGFGVPFALKEWIL